MATQNNNKNGTSVFSCHKAWDRKSKGKAIELCILPLHFQRYPPNSSGNRMLESINIWYSPVRMCCVEATLPLLEYSINYNITDLGQSNQELDTPHLMGLKLTGCACICGVAKERLQPRCCHYQGMQEAGDWLSDRRAIDLTSPWCKDSPSQLVT